MKRIVVLAAVALAIGGGSARADDVVPVDTVPVDVVPVDTVPVDTVPVEVVPVDTVPIDTVPVDTVPVAAGTVALPAGGVPNLDGSLVLAPTWLEPPADPIVLSPEALRALWEGAGAAYGIPWQVLASINKIESNFGRNMGPSSAGAIGWMQFMPSTWLRWGTDADGNGVADPWNPQDAIYSAARYLSAAGGSDLPRAIFAYNHADWYVREVLELARLYGFDGSTVSVPAVTLPASSFDVQSTAAAATAPVDDSAVFELDQLQERLDAAQQAVATTNAAYQPAVERAEELARKEQDLIARAASAALLSDELVYQKQAIQVSLKSQEAQFRVTQLRVALDQGQAELRSLREQVRAASFNRTAAKILAGPIESPTTPAEPADFESAATAPGAPAELAAAAPAAAPRWVFPVGGGPSTVSVGNTHHDYPAADIAAPEGAPVYALGDARVLHSWSAPDERCGIGLTLETTDGQLWTYCHLSYLEPSVTPGAQLAAGAPVGLVGATGHATGPHLHLQLQPPTSYPQEQEWFQSFADTAFHWQDAPTLELPAPAAPAAAAPAVAAPAEIAPPASETQPDTAQGLVFRIVQTR